MSNKINLSDKVYVDADGPYTGMTTICTVQGHNLYMVNGMPATESEYKAHILKNLKP